MLHDALRKAIFVHMKENAGKKDVCLDSVNGTADHVHTLISLKPDRAVSKVAQLLKGESSHWANLQSMGNIQWQDEIGLKPNMGLILVAIDGDARMARSVETGCCSGWSGSAWQ